MNWFPALEIYASIGLSSKKVLKAVRENESSNKILLNQGLKLEPRVYNQKIFVLSHRILILRYYYPDRSLNDASNKTGFLYKKPFLKYFHIFVSVEAKVLEQQKCSTFLVRQL